MFLQNLNQLQTHIFHVSGHCIKTFCLALGQDPNLNTTCGFVRLYKFLQHHEGGSSDFDICNSCKEFWLEFTMVVNEKRYFEWCRRTGESCLQNNVVDLFLPGFHCQILFISYKFCRTDSQVTKCKATHEEFTEYIVYYSMKVLYTSSSSSLSTLVTNSS